MPAQRRCRRRTPERTHEVIEARMSMPFSSTRSRTELGWFCLALAWGVMMLCTWNGAVLGDEWVHWHQIQRFVQHDYRVFDEYLTNIPGYHWLVTGIMWLFGADWLGPARGINAVFGLGALAAFYAARRHLHRNDARRATALLMFLPVLFPYWFLVYTDTLALALLLAAALASVKGHHILAALALVASMGVRQNNVFWIGVLALLHLWPLWRDARWRIWSTWRESLALAWPYGVAVLVFVAYWAWNGSISYSNAQGVNAHPDVKFDVGNPYYLLFIAGCLLPLHTLAGLRRFANAATRHWWLWLVPVAVFGLYAWLFTVHHPYNTFEGDYFLRNTLLQTVAHPMTWPWFAFGGIGTLAFCGLAFTRFVRSEYRWVLPLSLLFVGASWLIETRYAIVPMAMFLLLRVPERDWMERVTLAWWIVVSTCFAVGIFDFHFMI